MAIIVKKRDNDKKYILIGTGFGAYKSPKTPVFIGNRIPVQDIKKAAMIAACNEFGEIVWLPSEDLEVVEVDGNKPEELLR